ncbi:hypothetical protein F2Q69_00004836 [Brassica cretica]|uniref:START domain-containing protein n=1 Tax=Brassica cretica TaxID=69181 RepID=A0A8S9PRL3_BRACR|nr:hypothetical protein F2Q69_00004836 [Brassica cretica]
MQDWKRTFQGIVPDGATVLRDGELTRIQCRFLALTPKVPARTVSLLRVCKTLEEEEGLVVAVVDVSDPRQQGGDFNRFPSGVLLEKVGEGTTKVTWVEHCAVDHGLMGMAMELEGSNVGAFTSRRWLGVLKSRLIQSRTEVRGCDFPRRFLREDTFTIQEMVRKMVGDMLEVISPTIGEGWIQIPFNPDYFRIIYKQRKCVLIHSGWLEMEAEAIFQSFQEQRNAWDPSVNDILEVETDYGDGASLLRRRCGNQGRLQHLILQHFSPLSGMLLFSRLDHLHPSDLLTEGFAIIPCKERSLVTTVIAHKLPDWADLALETHLISAAELLVNKWFTLFDSAS